MRVTLEVGTQRIVITDHNATSTPDVIDTWLNRMTQTAITIELALAGIEQQTADGAT